LLSKFSPPALGEIASDVADAGKRKAGYGFTWNVLGHVPRMVIGLLDSSNTSSSDIASYAEAK
jgi:hypothetical protein